MFSRNLAILSISQALGMSAAPFITFVGGVIGHDLAPDPRLATLPVALTIVGVAAAAVPAALLTKNLGRRVGFIVGSAVAAAAAVVAAIAVDQQSFWLLCSATLVIGGNGAFVQQYRFAAAESVGPRWASRAISLVMLGALGAAVLGPELAQQARPAMGFSRDAAGFLLLGMVMLANVFVLSKLDLPSTIHPERPGNVRMRSVLWQPVFLVAVTMAAVAYSVMTLLMTATPISMHLIDDHPLDDTARVIQTHVFAMFLPSVFSGWLIHRVGIARSLYFGSVCIAACLLVARLGHELWHYWTALAMLGIGWNFLFVGGTTLISTSFRGADRFAVQGVNDFIVFLLNALAALGAGVAIVSIGWEGVIRLALPLLILQVVVLSAWAVRRA